MPVQVIKQDFVRFVVEKLGGEYPSIPNIGALELQAGLKGDAFRIELSQPEGRMVKFYPKAIAGEQKPFAVACYTNNPAVSILNLTAYGMIPAFIQDLLNEYAQYNDQHTIQVLLD